MTPPRLARFASTARFALASLLAGVGACGGGDGNEGDAGTTANVVDASGLEAGIEAGDFVDCTKDPRADHYVAGMEKAGNSGKVKIKLVSTPSPPIKGVNSWTVLVTDGAGAPLSGLTMKVTPYMPDHGHGSSVKPEVSADAATAGSYKIEPVYLFMAGLWQTTIDVTTGSGQSDAAVFSFCVER